MSGGTGFREGAGECVILLLASRRKERQANKGSERRREGEGDRGREELSSGDWVTKGKINKKGDI